MKKKQKRAKQISLGYVLNDETHIIPRSKGNGILKRQIWQDNSGNITRYSLVYINFRLCGVDNGRVLGFDNTHGYHHKHYMGTIEPVLFKNFENIEEMFNKEFEVLHEKAKKKKV